MVNDKGAMNELFRVVKVIVDNYVKNMKPAAVVMGTCNGSAVLVESLPIPISMISGNMKEKLKSGDKVRLLRNSGGSEYYILEIIGKPYYTECPEVCKANGEVNNKA